MNSESQQPTSVDVDKRRVFLKQVGAGAVSATVASGSGAAAEAAQEPRPVDGKDDRLVVLKAFPAVLETPTPLLTEDGLTPVNLLFVRNNQQPKDAGTTSAPSLKDWKIELTGSLNKTLAFDASELADFKQTEVEMVLQCSGNSRSLYAQTVETKGTQWGRGGMGNVKFAGVKLSTLLEKKGVRVKTSARYVTAEGRDDPLPGKEDFEHSLPIQDVLERSILALRLNGQPLPAIHGGPVRLVTPGVYATMNMKWLSRLRFEEEETTNYNQIPRYRVPLRPIKPGEAIEYTYANSRFNWGMKVKSVVLAPTPHARLEQGPVQVQGVAFNDGRAEIDSVQISLDQGKTWRRTKLQRPKSPYAWTRFAMTVRLPKGKHTIWTRAVDRLGRSQPLDGSVAWNPSGYEWNGVEKIDVEVV
ncbi:MAG TPA: sulfite reductase [Planctomycetaceae bacterium]|nr:sulfite reductase [Blastopirellula sp.]HAY78825.1 sulfite reductase [Planctomycetaceae bacterium]